ncbi:helix-turn-helix domain-containing protein [Microbispora sp. NPDC046933]|uniref:helix-turn-helix domain-containing protein n=1 Tax=Microbispora sp. NPDC046933 TaxID=3155618 RepID=UPI0033FC4545
MRLRCDLRLCPASGRRAVPAEAFGCARVVFNDGLRARTDAHVAGPPGPAAHVRRPYDIR